jgi:hypothetical protein
MESGLIKVKLKDLKEKTDSIQDLFEEPYPNFNSDENLELISRLYSSLKENLNVEQQDAIKKERKLELSEAEEAFWLPAISEALVNLKERKGSKNGAKIGMCLYDCSFTLGHYHEQIDV